MYLHNTMIIIIKQMVEWVGHLSPPLNLAQNLIGQDHLSNTDNQDLEIRAQECTQLPTGRQTDRSGEGGHRWIHRGILGFPLSEHLGKYCMLRLAYYVSSTH